MSTDDALFSKDELESLKHIDLHIETIYVKIPKINSEVFEQKDQKNPYLTTEYDDNLDELDLIDDPMINYFTDDYLSGLEDDDEEEPEDRSIHVDTDNIEEDNYDADPD